MNNCAVYTRVSTDMQAEKEFNSCETQELKIRRFIESQEDFSVYEVYSDPGFTGANTNRPALQKLLQDIQNKKIRFVISYKIDRLTRSPKDFYQLVEIFDKHNVDFISITERFDTSTPAGRLLRNLMLIFASFERELTSERVKDKMLERARKGFNNGGLTPFGYKKENKKLVIYPEQAEHIRNLFETYIESGSCVKALEVIKQYNSSFTLANASYMLRNPVYTGKLRYDGKTYNGIHDHIISEELFNTAQLIHKKKIKIYKIYRQHLFAGLIRCGNCNMAMTPSFVNKHSHGKLKRYFYYLCIQTKKTGWNSCPVKIINADKLENYISAKLEDISNDDFYLDALVRSQRGENIDLEYQERVEQRKTEIQFSAETLKNLLNAVIKIQKYEKGADRNLKIKKYISEIKYFPEKITIKFKDIAESDLSENVSSRTAARRPFSDSLLNQESPDTEAGFGVANSCIQEALEDSRGVLSGHLKRVRPEMYAPAKKVRTTCLWSSAPGSFCFFRGASIV